MPRKHPQVVGVDLNCSESRRPLNAARAHLRIHVRPARSIFEQSADFRCSAIAALVRLLTSDMHATCPGAPTSIFILLEVNLTQTIQDISIVSNSSSTDSMSTVACNAFRGAYDKHTGRAPWKRQVKTALERSGVMRCTVT